MYSPIGTVHLVFSLVAVALGTVVVLLPKGTRWHRTCGHGYAWSMVGVVVTALVLYNLTGRITPFHIAAVIAGITLAAGLWPVLARRPRRGWIDAHAGFMSWSYLGLLAALVAESLTRFVLPLVAESLDRSALWPAFWTLVAIGSFGVLGAGAWVIHRRLPAAVQSVPAAIRREREQLSEG